MKILMAKKKIEQKQYIMIDAHMHECKCNNIFLVEISQLQCTEIYIFFLGWYPEKSWGAEEDKHRKEKVITSR